MNAEYEIGQINLSNDWFVLDNVLGRIVSITKNEEEAKAFLSDYKTHLRKDIADIVNRLSEEYTSFAQDNDLSGLTIDVTGMYNAILTYCKDTGKKPWDIKCTMDNGYLRIDDKPIERFAEGIDSGNVYKDKEEDDFER